MDEEAGDSVEVSVHDVIMTSPEFAHINRTVWGVACKRMRVQTMH